jgi:hypothetical protein
MSQLRIVGLDRVEDQITNNNRIMFVGPVLFWGVRGQLGRSTFIFGQRLVFILLVPRYRLFQIGCLNCCWGVRGQLGCSIFIYGWRLVFCPHKTACFFLFLGEVFLGFLIVLGCGLEEGTLTVSSSSCSISSPQFCLFSCLFCLDSAFWASC